MAKETTIKYIVIIPKEDDEQEIKILDSLEEIKNLEFDSQEVAQQMRIFETEFIRKITFKTKVTLEI